MEYTEGTFSGNSSLLGISSMTDFIEVHLQLTVSKNGDSGSGRRGIGPPYFNHGHAFSGGHWPIALSWESEGLTWIE